MTAKRKKTQAKKAGPRAGRIARLRASAADDELFGLVENDAEAESRWNRPRKQRISLRVDREVVDWFALMFMSPWCNPEHAYVQ